MTWIKIILGDDDFPKCLMPDEGQLVLFRKNDGSIFPNYIEYEQDGIWDGENWIQLSDCSHWCRVDQPKECQ